MIVIVTSAYKINDQTGQPIKNDVLITDINPRDLKGQVIHLHHHKLVILNTTNIQADTPQSILDWLTLIQESIKNPSNPQINLQKPAIARAAALANLDEVSPEELAEAKIQEMRKEAIAFIESQARQEVEAKAAKIFAEVKEKADQELAKANQELMTTNEKAASDLRASVLKALRRGKLSLEEIMEDFGVSRVYIESLTIDLN